MGVRWGKLAEGIQNLILYKVIVKNVYIIFFFTKMSQKSTGTLEISSAFFHWATLYIVGWAKSEKSLPPTSH